MLIHFLEKYGAPPKIIDVTDILYTDLNVVMKIRSKGNKIPQTIGVR